MPASQFRGRVDNIDGRNGVVHGWALNLRAPTQPAILHILVDGQEIMQVHCDHPREDVRKSLGAPSNRVGFQFVLPGSALDGMPHTLSIRFDDRSALLFPDTEDPAKGHEVITFTQTARTEYRSCIDGIQEGMLRGWIIGQSTPSSPWAGRVAISVTVDGLPLGTFRADYYRGDVATALECDPNCGFEVPIPRHFSDGLPHEFRVVTTPDDIPLSGSPMVTSLVNDQLAAKLVQIENTIASLHQQLTNLRNEARSLLPRPPFSLLHYDRWAKQYYPLLTKQTALEREARPLTETPLVSVLCPTWQPNENDFIAAINSVLEQSYEHWELIIIDDGSRSARTKAIIQNYCRQDRRIRAITLKKNQGIAEATNAGIRTAKGQFIAFFDHDDLLVDVALERMVRAALATGAELLYSDEDKIDPAGHYLEPNLKPDFDYRYLLGCNYICHLTFVRTETARRIGPLKTAYNGAQDHDFLLRATEVLPAEAIHHVPEILYHWRKTPNSTASSIKNKGYAIQAGVGCVKAHLKRRKINAAVSSIDAQTLYTVRWPFRRRPSVSVIIPFRDELNMTRNCVQSFLNSQKYRNFEIILIDNFSVQEETLVWLKEIASKERVSVLRVEEPFNYARLNNLAARQSRSELLFFLNNDVIINQPDFLGRLVNETLAAPDIGAVGARLLYPTGGVQHTGVIVGPAFIGIHAHRLQPGTDYGYTGRIRLSHEVTAVTAAALLTPRSLFLELGGFDEAELPIAYNDVDLCLKIRNAGQRIVYCAEATATHYESHSRGSDDRPEHEARIFHEKQVMLERWKDNSLFKNDPAYPHYFREDLRTFFDLRDPEDLWS